MAREAVYRKTARHLSGKSIKMSRRAPDRALSLSYTEPICFSRAKPAIQDPLRKAPSHARCRDDRQYRKVTPISLLASC